MEQRTETSTTDGPSHDERVFAALSYVWFLSIILWLLKRDSTFVRFHARQGIILLIVSIVGWFIPVIGWVTNVVVFVLVVFGFVNALAGRLWRMPVVADWAEKLKL